MYLLNFLFYFILFYQYVIYKDNFENKDIDKDILPIYEVWLNDCIMYGVKPDFSRYNYILFTDTLNSGYAGLYVYREGILIKEEYRNSKYLKVIVYHELGHAAFGLEHELNHTSIMSPYFSDFFAQIYLSNWEKYKEQYFESVNQE
jgi:hypothetical protein